MRCTTCKAESSRIVADKNGHESCHNCRGFSEAGGVSTSGSLTRNAFRIRTQRDRHEGDFVQPHSYDRASGKVGINPDFVKLFPDQAGQYYSDDDLTSDYKNLPAHTAKVEAKRAAEKAEAQADVTYEGNADAGIAKVLS